MKLVLLAIVACVLAYNLDEPYIINSRIIDAVNNNPKSSWEAGVNSIFAGKKFSDVKNMMGALLTGAPEIPKTKSRPTIALPDSFETYEQWPSCKHAIRDQANCGSCWAFSAAEAMTDRFCIDSGAKVNVILSPQDFVSCESDEYACQGGYLSREWAYMEKTGIVSESCFPYQSATGYVPKCPYKCKDPSEEWKKYMAKPGSTIHLADMDSEMENMYKHGSFQVGFTVYQDFFSYKSGVYVHTSHQVAGGHAVKVEGWGIDSKSGKKYWNVANSWGTSWGMNGYFWIERGTDECGVEDQMYIADPLI
jgi:cathepsin B